MVQLLSASMGDLADYERLNDVIDRYYSQLIQKSPAWVREAYTKEMLVQDFACTHSMGMLAALVVVFTPMMKEITDPKNNLYDLFSYWTDRQVATNYHMDGLRHVKELLAR